MNAFYRRGQQAPRAGERVVFRATITAIETGTRENALAIFCAFEVLNLLTGAERP
jgi:hypothetical protein